MSSAVSRKAVLTGAALLLLAALCLPAYLFYLWVLYPAYYALFLQREAVHDFEMDLQPVPAEWQPFTRAMAQPRFARFRENPNYLLLLDAGQIRGWRPDQTGKVRVRFAVWGDRTRGVVGYRLTQIEGADYWGKWEAPVQGSKPGPSPFDALICRGPCANSQR